MIRKVFRIGKRVVISLPREVLEALAICEGAEVEMTIDRENRQVILTSKESPLAMEGVDEVFAQQVAEFIAQYRSALEALAK